MEKYFVKSSSTEIEVMADDIDDAIKKGRKLLNPKKGELISAISETHRKENQRSGKISERMKEIKDKDRFKWSGD